MIISAIPMNDDRIASHFTKAHSLLFVNEHGQEVSRQPNPALAAGCAGKQSLLDLLSAHHAVRVVVRNIGERMLGKLLDRQFTVVQTDCGRRAVSELANPQAAGLQPLIVAEQGRQSLNYEAKQGAGGCGHRGKAEAQVVGRCCEHTTTTDRPHGRCQGGGHGHGTGRGNGCGGGRGRGHS